MANQGFPEIVEKVQTSLNLSTKKAAETTTTAVVEAIVSILEENIATDGFSLKVPSLGKFSIKHTKGTTRKNPFKGNEVIQTKDKRKVRFATLSNMKKIETI